MTLRHRSLRDIPRPRLQRALRSTLEFPPMQRLLANLSTLQFVDYHRACGTRYTAAAVSIRVRNLASDRGKLAAGQGLLFQF